MTRPVPQHEPIDMLTRLDRDALLRLSWRAGHPDPPSRSSATLVVWLRRRGVGTKR